MALSSSFSSFFSWPPIKVARQVPELIRPARPTPIEMKPLSDIDDQEGLRFQVPFIMFYPNSDDTNKGNVEGRLRKDPVKAIKWALSEALVPYYPLAGRIREGSGRKLSVDCTGEGIIFIEEEADVTLEQLGESIVPPFPWITDFLYDVPGSLEIIGCPLLLIQVTRLACGGFVMAVRLNHTMSDSFGLVQFLNTAADVSRGNGSAPSRSPVWGREILQARDPPQVTCTHHEYEDVPGNSDNSDVLMDRDSMVQASFFFGPKEVSALRKRIPAHLSAKSSPFDLITACLWRCWAVALELHPEEMVRLSCTISARGKPGFEVPEGFYGNAFAYPAVLSRTGQLFKNPLGYALELVKTAKATMSKEYIQSAADLLVTRGRPRYTTVWNLLVSDASRAGLDLNDFGWGKLVYGGAACAMPLISIYGRYKNKRGEVGVVVPIWLPPVAMSRLREELIGMTGGPIEDFGNSNCVMASSL